MIYQCLEYLEKQKRRDTNTGSFTEAYGWASLFNGFAGKDGQKTSPSDFLPFPDDTKQKKRRISKATAIALLSLIRTDKLPTRIQAAASDLIDEAKELVSGRQ